MVSVGKSVTWPGVLGCYDRPFSPWLELIYLVNWKNFTSIFKEHSQLNMSVFPWEYFSVKKVVLEVWSVWQHIRCCHSVVKLVNLACNQV